MHNPPYFLDVYLYIQLFSEVFPYPITSVGLFAVVPYLTDFIRYVLIPVFGLLFFPPCVIAAPGHFKDLNNHFIKNKDQIEDALSDAFDFDTRTIFNDLTGNITMNPVGPRFLQEHYFDIFYKNSERGAIGVSIHEVIHYIWFYVWNNHFRDDYSEYEIPSLKWILSEMIVESIMSDERLCSINPYYPRENGGCVYRYFQNMIIDGKPILETLDKFYRENRIHGFMEQSYRYCLEFEKDIRYHINEAEKEF